MAKSGYALKGDYTIYAITNVDDIGMDVVFVGKSCSRDLFRILRYHREGRKKITAKDFSDATSYSRPTIHVLEFLPDSNAAIAYKHCLAWYRLAEDQGFIVLASDAFDAASYSMLPETKDIYESIYHIDIKHLLEIPYIPPKIANKAADDEFSADIQKEMVQLNLKIAASERDEFLQLCSKNRLTQREAFSLLLSGASNKVAKETIQKQHAVIQQLQDEVKKVPRGSKADVKLKEALSFCKTAADRYIELLFDEDIITSPQIECSSWNRFVQIFPQRTSYQFPEENGFSIMTLDALCYGQGRYSAIFLYGKEEFGQHIKIRYYPKKEYIGLSIPHSSLLYKGTMLLVGYRKARDGAMDLYIALPLMDKSGQPRLESIDFPEKLSLNELIRRSQTVK